MSANKVVEIPIIIKNYKKIESLNTVMVGGPVFMFTGPNNVGKTTMLQVLEAIMCVKDDNPHPVTDGQKEGFVEGTIPAANGKDYRYRYDFDVEGKKKFTFIDPDTNKKIKKITDIRKIFNYTGFSATDFFTWSATKDGREKQKKLVLGLLSKEELDAIQSIDNKIESGKGSLYLERTAVYNDLQSAKKNIEVLTEDEKPFIGNNDAAVKQKKKYETERSEYQIKLASITSRAEIKLSKEKDVTLAQNAVLKLTTDNKASITAFDDKIKELEKELASVKAKKFEFEATTPKLKANLEKQLDVVEKSLEVFNKEEVGSKEDLESSIAMLDKKIEAGAKYITNVALAEAKDKRIKLNDKAILDGQAEYDKKTTELGVLKTAKNTVISNSVNIPEGISIGEDCITVDGFDFNDKALSLSSAVKACIKLMIKINKDSKVLLVGDAESIGDPILKEIKQMAIDEDKILFFAEHDRRAEKFEINIYDELGEVSNKKPKAKIKDKKDPKSLF